MDYKKKCITCGRSFMSTDKNSKCCSSACGLKQGHIARESTKKYYICQHCGKPFWRPNAFRMKYCSKECEYEVRRLKAEERHKNKLLKEKAMYYYNCAYCGKPFNTYYPNNIYCSETCSYNGNLRLKREQWAEAYIPRTFICKECGAEVITKCADTRKEFCCQTCMNKYNRRIEHQTDRHKKYLSNYKQRREKQIHSAFVEHVSYHDLYKRDCGICQICGLPVLYDKQADDSWGATIDHIVPLSKGGAHSMNNCQITHRICNSLKSDNDEGSFSISWKNKANENNYWMQKYQTYLNLMKEINVRG